MSVHIMGMQIFYGYVRTLERFFSYDADGKLRFDPWNTAYGAVHPTDGPGTGKDDVELVLNDGEYFQVDAFYRSSEGGNFLDYRDAYKTALTCGEHRSMSRISIVTPGGTRDVTALAADGTEVVMGSNPEWRTVSIPERIRFINRPATKPEESEPAGLTEDAEK